MTKVDWNADRWNEVLRIAGKGIPVEESGLILNDDEKEVYRHLLEERAEYIAKYPNVPFEFAPVEKDFD